MGGTRGNVHDEGENVDWSSTKYVADRAEKGRRDTLQDHVDRDLIEKRCQSNTCVRKGARKGAYGQVDLLDGHPQVQCDGRNSRQEDVGR